MTEWRSRCCVSDQTLPLARGLPERVDQFHSKPWGADPRAQVGPLLLLLSAGVARASLGCSTSSEVLRRLVCKAGWRSSAYCDFKYFMIEFQVLGTSICALCTWRTKRDCYFYIYFYIRDRLIWLFIILINSCKRKINLCFTKSLFYL